MKNSKSEARNPKKLKPNYAFIDSQNLNLGVRSQGWDLDFKRFRIYLKNKFNIRRAYLFIGHIPANEELYNHLKDMGYELVLKPTTKYIVNGKTTFKGNVDAELVLYAAAKVYDNYDKAIIVSGDGDFYCLAEYLLENNKLERILAPNRKYSKLLKKFASYIVRLDLLREKLEYKKDQHRRSVETLGLSGHGDPSRSIHDISKKSNPEVVRNKKTGTSGRYETLGVPDHGDRTIIAKKLQEINKKGKRLKGL